MKKLINLMFLCAVLVLPFGVKAAEVQLKGECDKACKTGEAECTSVCRLELLSDKDDLSFNEFKGTLETSNKDVKITKIEASDTAVWTMDPVADLPATKVDFTLKPKTAGTPVTGKTIKLVTVTVKHAPDADCSIKLTSGEINTNITVTKPVKTGANLPVAIIVGGLGVALVIYATSKKNTKLYKI